MTAHVEFPLPFPYSDGTPQDHIDALRDHADLRTDGPLLDYAALAGAHLIEQQVAEIERLRVTLNAVESLMRDTDGGDINNDAEIPVGEIRRMIAEAVTPMTAVTCIRCKTTTSVALCCTSHNAALCHGCYRRTHFVEICVAGCTECAGEGLDPLTAVAR